MSGAIDVIRYSLRFLILCRKRWARWVLVVAYFSRLEWRRVGSCGREKYLY